MRESLQLFGAYNRSVNRKLQRVLAALDTPAIVTEEADAYFGSVLGILNHIAVSELRMLARLREARPDLKSLQDEVVTFVSGAFHQKPYGSIEEWSVAREAIDAVFLNVIAELGEEDARQEITLPSQGGSERRVSIGELLFHLFNHATHHRGQISQILDARGIAHDFSSFMAALRDQ